MKTCVLLLSLALGAWSARAQEAADAWPEFFEQAQAWATENLDSNFLAALPELDLAAVRETAAALRPLLEEAEVFEPFAAWLQPPLDYFKIANDFPLTVPLPEVHRPSAPLRVPSARGDPDRELRIFREQIEADRRTQAWPTAASNHVVQLKPIFAAERVPPELVWLAEVESSFNPEAVSPVGARGLFQLMPETAQRFGLSLWPRDQRRQTEPSARAAAQYLRFLYREFNDWSLALAAYNAGEGKVGRLVFRFKATTFAEIAPYLPLETQQFVPKVEAVLLRREGLRLAELPGVPPRVEAAR